LVIICFFQAANPVTAAVVSPLLVVVSEEEIVVLVVVDMMMNGIPKGEANARRVLERPILYKQLEIAENDISTHL
jgi:hypothetical protein